MSAISKLPSTKCPSCGGRFFGLLCRCQAYPVAADAIAAGLMTPACAMEWADSMVAMPVQVDDDA